MANLPERLVQYRRTTGRSRNRYSIEQHTGAAVAVLAYRERKAGRPDPTDHLETLPPIGGLDELFGRPQVAQEVRAKVARGLLYSRSALAGEGFDLLLGHIDDGGRGPNCGARFPGWCSFGQPVRAVRLAAALASGDLMTVRRAAAWSLASQYATFAIQFATSVIISRLFLIPGEVGLFSIALAAALIVAVFQDMGLTRFVSGQPEMRAEAMRDYAFVAVGIGWAIAAAVALAAPAIGAFYDDPRLPGLLWLIAASYLVVPFATVPAAMLVREMDFRALFTVNAGSALGGNALAIGLAAQGFGAASLAWSVLATGVLRAVLARALRPVFPRIPASIETLRPLLRFGSASFVISASGAIGQRSQDLIVGRLLGLVSTGLYSRAGALAGQLNRPDFRRDQHGVLRRLRTKARRRRAACRTLSPPRCLQYRLELGGDDRPCPCRRTAGATALWRELGRNRAAAAVDGARRDAVHRDSAADGHPDPARPDPHADLGQPARHHRGSNDPCGRVRLRGGGGGSRRIAYGLVWWAIYAMFQRHLLGFRMRQLLAVYARSRPARSPPGCRWRWRPGPAGCRPAPQAVRPVRAGVPAGSRHCG